ncbi:MAG TPA: hypothetical protein VFQ53_12555 [Kofleriaceae bacterium]|nr:hypothetical protein [Kofleriaceae bacterium]
MRAFLIVALAGLAGCEATAAPPPPQTFAQKLAAVRQHMHVRFAASSGVQLAIALSDLDRAHADARTIAALDEPDVLPEWKPYVDHIRTSAAQIAQTKDTVVASKALAQLGGKCAECHRAVPGAKVVFPKLPHPSDDPKLALQMAHHEWAAARMWEGLIAPSDERWLDGAKELSTARLTIAAEGGKENLGIANDVAKVRLLATRAIKAKSPDDRVAIYGELLGTCAHCHYTIRDR